MSETTTIVGGVVVVALAGIAAWFVTSRQAIKTVTDLGKPVTPATDPRPVVTTGPVQTGIVTGVIQQAPFQDQSGAALAAELAAQRAENARREAERKEEIRLREIDLVKNTLAATENKQKEELAEIQRLQNDDGGLAEQIKVVEAEITADCFRKHHGEWFNGEQQCRDKNLPDASNPAVPYSGYARWAPIKAGRIRTHEITLARLEEQFIGLKYDLKAKYGVDYIPSPVSVAAHEYAAAHPGR
jgi:hypothetical protein